MSDWWANNSSGGGGYGGDANGKETKEDSWGGGGGWGKEKKEDSWGKEKKEDSWGGGGDKAADADSWDKSASWDKAADTSAAADGNAGGWDKWKKDDAGGGGGSWDKGGNDSWNKAGGGGDDTWAKPKADEFWWTQTSNKDHGTLSAVDEWQLALNDDMLFKDRLGASAGLDFCKYDHVPVDVSGEKSSAIPACKTFEELFNLMSGLLVDELISNVRRCQYKTPTPVQKYAVPVGLVGRDIMCCAQTGSGKTAAYMIPVIGRMMQQHKNPVGALEVPFEGQCAPDSLILAPTRELAIQIHEEAQKFCHRTKYLAGILYGGCKPKDQMAQIAKGCDVMVATPGRLQDFIGRGIVKVEKVNVLVLDEADRMLDMGFEPQIRDIIENNGMPSKDSRQTMMFSATFSDIGQKMAQDYMFNHIWIGVGIMGAAVDTVEQCLVKVPPKGKFEKLVAQLDQFLNTPGNDFEEKDPKKRPRCMVFANAKDTAKWLDEQLYDMKIDTGALHGNLTQDERETNLRRFRDGQIDVMIATDVAARGLDIENVSLVINYDMPQEIDSYIHRIGRTGRIGNRGKALTFISIDDNEICLEKIETVTALLQVMRDSNCDLPDWLEHLIENTNASKSNSYKWGGKDARGGEQDRYQGTGGGDAWGNWNKSQGNDDSWGNKDNKDNKDANWGNNSSW